ncbi:MAG: hypothetical protein JST38_21395 [Bacteroidetes bacterium]|nr:hypothetical protein [Bacteroidota bacterium]
MPYIIAMEKLIGPHIHAYLHHPLFSAGEAMLYYTVEQLVYNGATSLDHSQVQVGHGDHHVVSRLFLSRAADPASLPAPEAFVLALFPDGKALSLADLRRHLDHAVPETHAFKTGPMQEHLLKAGLLTSPHQDSPEGRAAYHQVSRLLHNFEHEEERLLHNKEELQARLKELGANVVLLHWRLRDKLKESPHIDGLTKTLLVIQTFLESGGYYHTRMMG